jgi:DNA processing protein
MLNQWHTPKAVFDQVHHVSSVSERTKQGLLHPKWDEVERDLAWLDEKANRYIVTIDDPRYPTLLKQIADPPCLLFVEGNVDLLSTWQLAMVGSRNPTASGRDTAYEFARYLTQAELTITSGLAMGVDAAAHQGALSSMGKTIAVVGTGLDIVYPSKHKKLADQIIENGAIVSEFPIGTTPRAENFPRRNRLISGLSLGTLVVEAALQSGSLITARTAMEQGREVFAIPGSIHNPLARGCHKLIKEGVKLVETGADIIEELGALACVSQMTSVRQQSEITRTDDDVEDDADYQCLFEHLGFDPVSIDVLISKSKLTAEVVSSMLLLLELQGRVESLPGGRYTRTKT